MPLKTLYRLLHPVASITQKLQARIIDIVKTYQEIQSSILDMQVVQDKVTIHTKDCLKANKSN